MTAYSPENKTDMVESAVAALLPSYKEDPLFVAWLTVLVDRVQEAEDTVQAIINMLMLDNAEGVWLDLLGRFVGQPRTSADDDVYLVSIKARVRINISNGGLDDIIKLGFLLLDSSDWGVHERYPNTMVVTAYEFTGDPTLHAKLFQECAAAARAIRFVYSSAPRNATFTFTDAENPAGTQGEGVFASVEVS